MGAQARNGCQGTNASSSLPVTSESAQVSAGDRVYLDRLCGCEAWRGVPRERAAEKGPERPNATAERPWPSQDHSDGRPGPNSCQGERSESRYARSVTWVLCDTCSALSLS
jgi:hypothetical protein